MTKNISVKRSSLITLISLIKELDDEKAKRIVELGLSILRNSKDIVGANVKAHRNGINKKIEVEQNG